MFQFTMLLSHETEMLHAFPCNQNVNSLGFWDVCSNNQ